jgi:hypothetical protein
MNYPFDDRIPEEAASAGPDLAPLLRQVYQQPVPLSDMEQKQILARVRERLLRARADLGPSPVQEQAVHPAEEAAALPLQPVPAPAVPRRLGVLRFISALAAVLVVGALIGGALLLFSHNPRSSVVTTAPAGQTYRPEAPPVTIHAEHNGLEASMTLTGGPYFLSETLAVDMTLTNHTQTTFSVEGFPADSPCESVPFLEVDGGGPPLFNFPYLGIDSCPFISSQLKPGQTFTIHHYETLTASGKLKLTEGARFLVTETDANGNQSTTDGPSPLDGYWPSVTIQVSPQVPQDYQLSFKQEGSQVSVIAPAGAQSHLLYIYYVGCQDKQGPGGTETGDAMWRPLSTTTVKEPGCPGINIHWDFAFSAPGYATVSGSASF